MGKSPCNLKLVPASASWCDGLARWGCAKGDLEEKLAGDPLPSRGSGRAFARDAGLPRRSRMRHSICAICLRLLPEDENAPERSRPEAGTRTVPRNILSPTRWTVLDMVGTLGTVDTHVRCSRIRTVWCIDLSGN